MVKGSAPTAHCLRNMSINIRWYNKEKTIFYWEYQPGWTWNDFRACIDKMADMLVTINHATHHIINWQQTSPPGDEPIMANWALAARKLNHKRTSMIVVNASPFIKALNRYFLRTSLRETDHLLFADTVDEAYDLLQEHPDLSSANVRRVG